MSPSRDELTAALGVVLDEHVSGVVAAAGFGRRTKALTYRRRHGEWTQVLNVGTRVRPPYAPGADLHVFPVLELGHDEVRDRLARLWPDEAPMLPRVLTTDLPELPHGSIEWYFTAGRSSDGLGAQLASCFQADVVPLADAVRDAASFVAACQGAGWPGAHAFHFQWIAAAADLVGDRAVAEEYVVRAAAGLGGAARDRALAARARLTAA